MMLLVFLPAAFSRSPSTVGESACEPAGAANTPNAGPGLLFRSQQLKYR